MNSVYISNNGAWILDRETNVLLVIVRAFVYVLVCSKNCIIDHYRHFKSTQYDLPAFDKILRYYFIRI